MLSLNQMLCELIISIVNKNIRNNETITDKRTEKPEIMNKLT